MSRFSILSILILLSIYTSAQFIYSDTTWERWYGIQNYNESMATANQHIEHYDKGYIFHGRNQYPVTQEKPFIKKTDVNGYFLWEKKLDSLSNITITCIKNESEGGILICGAADGSSVSNPYVAKLNACMEIEWCKIFDWSEFSYAIDLEIDQNGDIVVLTAYFGYSPGERINLIKLDPDGEVLWKENYATIEDHPYIWNADPGDLIISEDNHYYIAGDAEWPTNNDPGQGGGERAFFVKVTPDGNEEWVLPFGIYDNIYGSSYNIIQITENKFLSMGRMGIHPVLHYFNANGEELSWYTNEFFQENYWQTGLHSPKKINDTSFFAIWGYFYTPDQIYGHTDYIVFDTALNILDYKEEDPWDCPCSLIKTYNNKLVTVAKMKEAEKTTYYDIYLNKLNHDFTYDTVYTNWNGNYDTLCEDGIVSGYLPYDCDIIVGTGDVPTPGEYKEAQEKVEIQMKPNPAHTQVSLMLGNTSGFKKLRMSVYNQTGEEIYQRKLRNDTQEELLNTNSWSSGMYFIVIRSENKIVGSAKLMVE